MGWARISGANATACDWAGAGGRGIVVSMMLHQAEVTAPQTFRSTYPVSVAVVRHCFEAGACGDVEVTWRCVGLSARYGSDFVNSSGVVRWPAGDTATKYITVYVTRAAARVRAVEMAVEIVRSRNTPDFALIPRNKERTIIRLVRCTGGLTTTTFNGRVNPHRGAMGGAGACAPDLVAVKCGDGSRDLWEECDDGGRVSGDGCSSACSVEAYWWCFGGTLTRADR